MKCVICSRQADLPQWCQTCGKPHQETSELTHDCMVAAMCQPCAVWDHDRNGDPGAVTARASDPLSPTPDWPRLR